MSGVYEKARKEGIDLKVSDCSSYRIVRTYGDKVHDQTERARLDIHSAGRSVDPLAIRGWLSARSDETPRLSRPTYARPLPRILFFSPVFPFLSFWLPAVPRTSATCPPPFIAYSRSHGRTNNNTPALFSLTRLISHFASHPPQVRYFPVISTQLAHLCHCEAYH